tara:strand:+ start:135 stop:377 length:243 start_codon:yes stop_codon:yes gene_type:complete
MSQYLNDPEYLFSILTALVKKNGGRVELTEQEMQNVSKGDLMGMYYEPKTGTLILKEIEPEDMLRATSIVRDKPNKVYEN